MSSNDQVVIDVTMEGKDKPEQEQIKITLYSDTTPKLARSFVEACSSGKLNGTKFTRITRNGMLEGGTGGDQAAPVEEANFARTHGSAGVLTTPVISGTYTTEGPAHFCICTSPMPWLDGQYVVFGQVTNRSGLDLICSISNTAGTPAGIPRKVVTISTAAIASPSTIRTSPRRVRVHRRRVNKA